MGHLKYSVCLAFVFFFASLCIDEVRGFFGSGDKVRLRDINTLTLYNGRMTTGRRSSPVKQLQCVGGSAGCSAFTPQVVQCSNRGSDGYDAQWECKTDMDNSYRFGSIEVSCEGYDYPEDEYVLKGSCGLEYTLDLTKEGMKSNQYNKQHSYYGDESGYHGSSHNYYGSYNKSSGGIGDWIMLAIIGVIIYGIYRSCMATSPTDSDYPDDQSGNRWGNQRMGGGGFGSGSTGGYGGNSHNSGGCGGTANRGTGGGVGGGGFWSGAAAGGLLGYMFGNRGGYNRGYGYGRPRHGYSSGWGSSGWGGSSFGGGRSFGGGGGGFSSGTRTASGFGGTRRR